jgi:hypothetical protein
VAAITWSSRSSPSVVVVAAAADCLADVDIEKNSY